jgi:2-oxo-hept-3-ene-1,7-dioate hydratase
MLTDDERRRGAQLLFDAERQRKAIPQLSQTFPRMEIVDAYRIQDLWAEMKMAPGVSVAGHKIGLTSRAMQMASKMTEPDYGRIFDDAIYNDGAQIPAGRFLKPRLEVELAFVMGEDLEGPGRRIYDVMRAAEYVVPALEIIDYRTEVPRAITDTIADNAAFGAIVVGGRPIRPMDVDIRWVGATLKLMRTWPRLMTCGASRRDGKNWLPSSAESYRWTTQADQILKAIDQGSSEDMA